MLLVDAVYGEVERLSRALRQRPRCKVLCCWGESTAAGSAASWRLGERAEELAGGEEEPVASSPACTLTPMCSTAARQKPRC